MVMVKKILNIILIPIVIILAQDTPGWKVYPSLAGSNHTIAIPLDVNPKINGIPLVNGDYIGVFYDSLGKLVCGGFKKWDGNQNIAITAFGDDNFTENRKEGFANGENFIWKVWKKNENKIYDAAVQFRSGPTAYAPNGTSILKSLSDKVLPPWEFTETNIFHTIVLPSNLVISINNIKQVPPVYVGGFYDSLGSVACAGYGEWDGASNVEFKLYGDIAQTSNKEGFSVGEKIIFRIFIVSEKKVVEVKAKVRVNSPNDTFFVQNGRTILDSLISVKVISADDPGWTYTQTTNYHKVSFPSRNCVKIDDDNIADGDYIGAFYKKAEDTLACAGFFQWVGDIPQELTIWADYPDTKIKEGYSVGDRIILLIWRKSSQATFTTNISWINDKYNYPNDSIFAISSVYKDTIKLDYGLSGVELMKNDIPEKYYIQKQIFFNDFHKKTSYKLIGFPGIPSRRNAYLLDSLFQGKANQEWSAYQYLSNNKLLSYNSNNRFNFKFIPGKAFWILSKYPLIIDVSNFFQVYNVPTNVILKDNKITAYYEISLDTTGNLWNLIANPFDQPILWKDIIDFNNSDFLSKPIFETDKIYDYLGTQGFKNQSILEPYRGYFYYNRTKIKKLKIPYTYTKIYPKINKEQISENLILEWNNNIDTATIKIINNGNSTIGLDKYDELMPPISFSSINAFLVDKNVDVNEGKLLAKATSISNGKKFDIKVISKNGKFNLLLNNNLSSKYKVILINKSNLQKIDLTNSNQYSYENILIDTLYLEFIIGTDEYIEGIDLKIEKLELYQNYPNPFNPVTKISYSIPSYLENQKVNLKIYDILGKEVVTLVNTKQSQGYYTVDFDANNLASGIYIAQLRVGNFVKNIKMQLLK